MKQFTLFIDTLAPVLIADKSGDSNMVATRKYIPGTTIQGLLARQYIQRISVDEDFFQLFFTDQVSFGNAHPCIDKEIFHPTPLSIHKLKNGDKVYDLLFEDQNFNEQTKAVGDFSITSSTIIRKVEVKTSINFHNIMENGKTRKEGGIFNYQSIDPGQTFAATIVGEEGALTKISALIPQDTYIGRSKTSQYGKVRISTSEIIDFLPQSKGDNSEGHTMTLLSDAIILNDNGMSEVSYKVMASCIGVEIEDAFVRRGIFENYVNVLKAKRPAENVFKAGSCFKLIALPDDYENLEKKGIGQNTNEGFGRVVFNLQQGINDPIIKEIEKEIAPPPDVNHLPDITKNILLTALKEKLRNAVIKKALEDADSFSESGSLITNSLAYRLKGFAEYGIESFERNLTEIRKNANDALHNCKNNQGTLFDFLKSLKEYLWGCERGATGIFTSIKNEYSSFPEIIRDQLEVEFNGELFTIYTQTFFTHFRLMNKKK